MRDLWQKLDLKRSWVLALLGGILLAGIFGMASCSRRVARGRFVRFPYSVSDSSSLNSKHNDQDPQISGRYLTYVSDRRGKQEVMLFDLRNRRLMPLQGLARFDSIMSQPSVSENGNWIVFAASQNGRTGIYLYRRNTRQVRNLVPSLKGEVRNPTISGNGDRIAFEVSRQGQWDIAVYNRQGRPISIPGNAVR